MDDNSVLCSHCLPIEEKLLLQGLILLSTDLPCLLQPFLDILSQPVAAPLGLDVSAGLISIPPAS